MDTLLQMLTSLLIIRTTDPMELRPACSRLGFFFTVGFCLFCVLPARSQTSVPLNCSDITRVCASFLSYRLGPQETLAEVESLFDVVSDDITLDQSVEGENPNVFIKKNCSCVSSHKQYLSNTTYTVRQNGGSLASMVAKAYEGLAWMPNTSRNAYSGAVVSLHLLCGCSSSLWNYLLSYAVQPQDTLSSLASRFGVSMKDIETVNNITDPDFLSTGTVYYIPLNSGGGIRTHPHTRKRPSQVEPKHPNSAGLPPRAHTHPTNPPPELLGVKPFNVRAPATAAASKHTQMVPSPLHRSRLQDSNSGFCSHMGTTY